MSGDRSRASISVVARSVRRWMRREYRASAADLKQDAVAAVPAAMSGIADGMGSGILAGVNPMHGLYAAVAGQTAGALAASSRFMTINTTSATALIASGAIVTFEGDARTEALLILTLVMGIVQIAAGVLRLGSLTRFVSDAVMTGFLTGVAILIILGQLGNFTGYQSSESNKVSQAVDLLRHLGEVDGRTLAAGTLAFALAILLPRTRLGNFGIVFALIIPSVLVALLTWDGVALVGDDSEISGGLPDIGLPSLSVLNFDLVTVALAVAIVGLVQGAGVAQKFPNPGGTLADPSQDFAAQGIANAAASMFSGMPVGGSVGATGLNVSVGARTRWANVFCAGAILLMILLLSELVSRIVMAALAGLLITVGLSIVNPREALTIWRVSWTSRIAVLLTFVATLVTPIQVAVGIGVALSAILYLYQASAKVKIVERRRLPDGRYEEVEPPATLPSNAVTFLDVYGSLFYAGAYMFERALPSPRGVTRAVVVLRMRGQSNIGITFINSLARYAQQISAADGRLYLSGVSEAVHAQLERTRKVGVSGAVSMYTATSIVGESSELALEDAAAWLIEHVPQPDEGDPAAVETVP
jgi:SulP family sulfate permease